MLRAELQKLLSQRKAFLLLVILFVVAFSQAILDRPKDADTHAPKTQIQYWIDQPSDQLLDQLQTEIDQLAQFAEMQQDEQLFLSGLDEQSVDPDLIQAYLDYPYKDTLNEDLNTLKELYQSYEQIIHYDAYLDTVQERIQALQEQIFWSSLSAWKKQDLVVMSSDYQKLIGIQPSVINDVQISKILENNWIAYYLLAGAGILAWTFGTSDDQQDMDQLIATTKCRKTSFFSKMFALGLLNFLFAGLLLLGIYLIYGFTYGFTDLFTVIQSVRMMTGSPYQLTIMSWLLLCMFLSSMATAGLSLATAYLLRLRNSGLIPVVLSISLLFGLQYLWQGLDDLQQISWLRILIPFHALNAFQLFVRFNNSALFSYHLTQLNIALGQSLILISVFTLLHMNFQRHMRVKKDFVSEWFWKQSSRFIRRFKRRDFEWYKTYIMNGGLIIAVCFSGILVFLYQKRQPMAHVIEQSHSVSLLYQEYGGYLDQDKIQWLAEQEAKLQDLQQQFQELKTNYRLQQITAETYFLQTMTLIEQTRDLENVSILLDTYNKTDSDWLIYPNGYQVLFGMNTNLRNIQDALLLTSILLLLLAPLYAYDRSAKQDLLYVTTVDGRQKRKCDKLVVAFLTSTIFFILLTAWQYGTVVHAYAMDAWHAPVSAVAPSTYINNYQMPDWLINIPLITYYLLSLALRYFGVLSFSLFVLFLSQWTKNTMLSVIIALLTTLLPLLSLGFTQAHQFLGFIDLLYGNPAIWHMLGIVVVVGIVDVAMLRYLCHDKKGKIITIE